MTTYTIGAEPSLSLEQLSDWLWGQEVAFGPVIAIGNNGHSTAATLQWADVSPSKRATISPTVDGKAIIPQGAKLLCQGDVFITSQMTNVAVIRPA